MLKQLLLAIIRIHPSTIMRTDNIRPDALPRLLQVLISLTSKIEHEQKTIKQPSLRQVHSYRSSCTVKKMYT